MTSWGFGSLKPFAHTDHQKFADKVLDEHAAAHGMTAGELLELNPQITVEYRIESMSLAFQVRFGNRGVAFQIDPSVVELMKGEQGGLMTAIKEQLVAINLRAELYHLRLHRQFPRHLAKVTAEENGVWRVMFKNGRSVCTSEDKLASTEFLATCGMIYDL